MFVFQAVLLCGSGVPGRALFLFAAGPIELGNDAEFSSITFALAVMEEGYKNVC